MTRRTFSGREVVKVLRNHRFSVVGGGGSHRKLAYLHPKTGEKRTVVVPMHDEISIGTLHDIADQAGANDFDAFCEWIAENC